MDKSSITNQQSKEVWNKREFLLMITSCNPIFNRQRTYNKHTKKDLFTVTTFWESSFMLGMFVQDMLLLERKIFMRIMKYTEIQLHCRLVLLLKLIFSPSFTAGNLIIQLRFLPPSSSLK